MKKMILSTKGKSDIRDSLREIIIAAILLYVLWMIIKILYLRG